MTTRRELMRTFAMATLAAQVPRFVLGADAKASPAPSPKKDLVKAKIPSTGEELARIGLGTYRTFDVEGDAEKRKALSEVLKAFVDQGGTLIDSSPMYHSSEEVVGALSTATGLNAKLFMATKVWTSGKDAGLRQMNESFEKLGRAKGRLELMQIHNLVDWKTHLPQLRKWKEEGRVKYIGITHYDSSAFGEMAKVLESEPMDFLQIPYSLRETAAEKRLLPLAAKKGVAVIANEPFAQGELFRAVKSNPVPAWAKDAGIHSWAQYFLKFILATGEVQFAIPGTSKVDHLNDNMSAARGPMPTREQREKMRREIASL